MLEDVGDESGLWFIGVKGGALPHVEAIDQTPRIAV